MRVTMIVPFILVAVTSLSGCVHSSRPAHTQNPCGDGDMWVSQSETGTNGLTEVVVESVVPEDGHCARKTVERTLIDGEGRVLRSETRTKRCGVIEHEIVAQLQDDGQTWKVAERRDLDHDDAFDEQRETTTPDYAPLALASLGSHPSLAMACAWTHQGA